MAHPNPAIVDDPAAQADRLYTQGLALFQMGWLAQAQERCQQVLATAPAHFDALHLSGAIAGALFDHRRAVDLIERAIEIKQDSPAAYFNRGIALHHLLQHDAARLSYEHAIALQPDHAEAYNNLGSALYELDRYSEALQCYGRAIALAPDFAPACYNRGNAWNALRRYEEALQSFDAALALQPGYVEAYNNRGNVLKALGRHEAALLSFEHALAIDPYFVAAYNSTGAALGDLRQPQAALDWYERAIALKPDYAEAYNSRGNALRASGQNAAALASFSRVFMLEPNSAVAYYNHGNALNELMRHEVALHSFDQAFALEPGYPFLYGLRLHTRMLICDWNGFDAQLRQLTERIERNDSASAPFAVLALTDRASVQRRAAETWVREKFPVSRALPAIAKRPRHERIRVGYFSADFRNHPIAYLTAGLIESHDRARFEVIGFSIGPASTDEMRSRMAAAFERFVDVRDKSDIETAQLARQLEVDIAIDLGGFTRDTRAGIFALRAAPLQASYLGYLGTMGAEYIDYLIADDTLIPESQQKHYREKIVYLPSYQANDTQRQIAAHAYTREELGLPRSGFVYCCFNHSYKITPAVYDGWMRILRAVPGSVLFLLADNDQAMKNLSMEAVARGVAAERVIFGKRLSLPEYLARYRVADLFLDTHPYNAGTTASDALWAGLPVLTRTGEAFASRVAASLLHAIHLPELVAATPEAYEALAIELATDAAKLDAIRAKLEKNRLTTPLFDTRLFAGHLEAAYTQMYERYQADLPPEHIGHA